LSLNDDQDHYEHERTGRDQGTIGKAIASTIATISTTATADRVAQVATGCVTTPQVDHSLEIRCEKCIDVPAQTANTADNPQAEQGVASMD
jgi:hypothetical protein